MKIWRKAVLKNRIIFFVLVFVLGLGTSSYSQMTPLEAAHRAVADLELQGFYLYSYLEFNKDSDVLNETPVNLKVGESYEFVLIAPFLGANASKLYMRSSKLLQEDCVREIDGVNKVIGMSGKPYLFKQSDYKTVYPEAPNLGIIQLPTDDILPCQSGAFNLHYRFKTLKTENAYILMFKSFNKKYGPPADKENLPELPMTNKEFISLLTRKLLSDLDPSLQLLSLADSNTLFLMKTPSYSPSRSGRVTPQEATRYMIETMKENNWYLEKYIGYAADLESIKKYKINLEKGKGYKFAILTGNEGYLTLSRNDILPENCNPTDSSVEFDDDNKLLIEPYWVRYPYNDVDYGVEISFLDTKEISECLSGEFTLNTTVKTKNTSRVEPLSGYLLLFRTPDENFDISKEVEFIGEVTVSYEKNRYYFSSFERDGKKYYGYLNHNREDEKYGTFLIEDLQTGDVEIALFADSKDVFNKKRAYEIPKKNTSKITDIDYEYKSSKIFSSDEIKKIKYLGIGFKFEIVEVNGTREPLAIVTYVSEKSDAYGVVVPGDMIKTLYYGEKNRATQNIKYEAYCENNSYSCFNGFSYFYALINTDNDKIIVEYFHNGVLENKKFKKKKLPMEELMKTDLNYLRYPDVVDVKEEMR